MYAFARMRDGAVSKVIVLNRAAINKIKATSQGANSDFSPWKTHEPAMWLKSAVRQLAKWVPTSAEYMREQMRAARDVAAEADPGMGVPRIPAETVDVSGLIEADPTVDDVLDAELVDRSDEQAEIEAELAEDH